ncbi:MAG TPA: hypothetical protein VHM24_10760 [Gemmatimonadaceae bacterium]|nr:hypothetical protein [Gemmatimonadaceae bacterium]
MNTRFSRPARLVAAGVIPFVLAAATPVADGMSYEFVMKSTSRQTGNKEQVTLRGRGVYAGDDAKIEILEAASSAGGEQAFGGKGTYFIVKDGGKEMLLVNPAEKSYMKWDMQAMFAGIGKVVNAVGGLVKLQMSDVRIDARDLGAGESVQGYPTKHIQVIQNYTMTAKVFGKTSASKSETTTDYYFAPSLRIANPFMSNSQQMAMMSQLDMFNNPEYKSQMSAAMAKIPKTGVPLKTVTTTVTTDEKGKKESNVTVMEMVNFKASNIPQSTFAIPSGYTMVEMPNMSASMASGGSDKKAGEKSPGFNADSVAAAAKQGAKEGVKEGVKDETKAAVTKKIKGIFKR